MQLNCQIDGTELIARLDKGQRRLAYGVVNALNNTAKRIQAAERDRVSGVFQLRKADFVKRQAAIIKPFASVRDARPYVEVSVGQKPRLLLSAFEQGGERKPMTAGAKHSAVPIIGGPARPSFAQQVPDEFTFKKLRLKRGRKAKGRRTADVTFARSSRGQVKGEHRTFILPKTAKAPHGGVFQRIGPGRDDIRMIYSFADVRLPAALEFIRTARREAQRWFKEEMQRETVNAIQRARGRGL